MMRHPLLWGYTHTTTYMALLPMRLLVLVVAATLWLAHMPRFSNRIMGPMATKPPLIGDNLHNF